MDNSELITELVGRISFLEGAVLRLASVQDSPPVDEATLPAPPVDDAALPALPALPVDDAALPALPAPPVDDAQFYYVRFTRTRRRRHCSVCKEPGHDKRKHVTEK